MISIRQPDFSEAAMLAALGRRTFEEAFADQNTPENMAAYLAEAYATAQFEREMRDENAIFYVVSQNGSPVGYAKLRKNSLPDPVENSVSARPAYAPWSAGRFQNDQTHLATTPCVELQRIYVLREKLGLGVGKLLMAQCVQTARLHGCRTIWLGVWEHNPKAIAFYEKWGFTVFGSHIFHVGNDPQTDLLMQRGV